MATATSTLDIGNYLGLYLDMTFITVTGPVTGVWTITSTAEITQAQLDAGVASTVTYVTALNNRAALIAKGAAAQSANNTFIALAAPTNAQVTAQVKALSRQVNALLKLATEDLSNTTGT